LPGLIAFTGKELAFLAEGCDGKGPFERSQGRAPEDGRVARLNEGTEFGAFAKVEITDTDINDLKGEVIE
jgi:tRNA A37 methylthiotransferase MiaB